MRAKLCFAIAITSFFLSSTSSYASFHLWSFSEVFSNSDGTIQYIELTTTSATEQALSGHALVSSGSGVATMEFVFNSNLVGSTSNKKLLLATERFARLTGLDPDFVIPAGFIPLSGGTLNFGEGSQVLNFSAGSLPLNGVQSMTNGGQAQVASPETFGGLNAQLPVQANPYASFDVTSNVLNVPVLDAGEIGIGNVNFTVDLESLEFTLSGFYLYAPGTTAGDQPAVFDGASLHVPALVFNTEVFDANLFLVNESPIVLGNPEILSVSQVQPDPDPEPQPDPLQESITRGQTQFGNQCAICHGDSGQGVVAPNLQFSNFNTFDALRPKINNTMPQGNSSACQDTASSTCATDVANFILNVIQT